jgi:hypothetical protein
MRNILLLYIMSTSALFVNAQLKEGNGMLGGRLSYFSHKNSYEKMLNPLNPDNFQNSTITLTAGINAGYLVFDKLAIGISYNHSYGKINMTNVQRLDTETVTLKSYLTMPGLFSRFYMMTKDEKFGFFFHLAGNYLAGGSEQVTEHSNGLKPQELKLKNLGFNVGVYPGIVYFVSKKMGIEAGMGAVNFISVKTEEFTNSNRSADSKQSFMTADFGISYLFLGASIYFGKKESGNVREK